MSISPAGPMAATAASIAVLQVNPPVSLKAKIRQAPSRAVFAHCSGPTLSRTRVAQRHRSRVQAACAIAVEGTLEDAPDLSCRKGEQGHGRAELEIIRRPKDRLNGSSLNGQHRFGAQDQS